MSSPTFPVATLGMPRIGPRRELKSLLEGHWAGTLDAAALTAGARELRAANWARQSARGVSRIPSNDFSLYDHVLDTTVMVGAVPARYGWDGGEVDAETYFAMARGRPANGSDKGAPAMDMTKWFDTNYHVIVPELARGMFFTPSSSKAVAEYREAKARGHETRPVLLGPVTYLLLAKANGFDPLSLLPGLLPVYQEVLHELTAAGASWVQIDEPCLGLDLDERTQAALKTSVTALAQAAPSLKLMLTSYFGGLGHNEALVLGLPVAGLHLDLVRAPGQLQLLSDAPSDLTLSLGVVDGRNVWRADLVAILGQLEPLIGRRSIELAPSCPLLHVPLDLDLETDLDPEIAQWLAFGAQKMDELTTLATGLEKGRTAIADALEASEAAIRSRRLSSRVNNPVVRARSKDVDATMTRRTSPFAERRMAQRDALSLPQYPTTTIGSFPQTRSVRKARAAHAHGMLSAEDYARFIAAETEVAVRRQEEIGLDMLVHGEFERNDMVQYFGERLDGYAFTRSGWVQSYGSRCVRPPILFGDVARPAPMTVKWSSYAQSLTDRPMKGILTGPVTMLQWSFVRDDLPRPEVCRQIALAIRDEVQDLEAAGLAAIQVDEPALREGVPLREADRAAYLAWAVECFRLATAGVSDATQIHTHMCYAAFNDIIDTIGAMDADVIAIESSRSRMELLDAFPATRYPNEIGPGVYDTHSPRVPSVPEMVALLQQASERLDPSQIWVNPDCGLKTREWDEVRRALLNMVAAARRMRDEGRVIVAAE
ncbi:5-methyltetrahydropteroyltriglutamate--homocysteine S-methyltransferase [Acuticoccus sp. M5D2P5]|uniref:5-methyltetrahydropteroyltriglutamate-- homocysteine S-methyltransferase n=1 Tax=Acuticoccus kalidii TaxID=2910977 RepID=UPI001F2506D6|nr:5-methyltetrahydropteroyltriglutamate--homocysteine S-methyltransferase [Acuticoccus kalidii]MCF3933435.1 5-methyltetrahydropteroyltriglutamate--homocysteine S-methyltransferase [Acuticoccus kalidii]